MTATECILLGRGSGMGAADWLETYAALSERLRAYAKTARMTFCGLSACVDAYLQLHECSALFASDPATPAGALARELLCRAEAGVGGEFFLDWPEGPAWLDRHIAYKAGVGGTGPQAAQSLALLGAPVLVALADRSPAQCAVMHDGILLAGPDGTIPVRQAASGGTPKPAHYIFEYSAGVALGAVVPRRSTRVIVRFADDDLEDDPAFETLSLRLAAGGGAGILSGFNGLPDACRETALATGARFGDAWRQAGLDLVHLELGAYQDARAMRYATERLAGHASSLGMSHSELTDLVPGDAPIAAKLGDLAARHGLDRVCVHADDWAMSLTRGDPARELEALLAGSLLASCRAAAGQPVVPDSPPPGASIGPLPDFGDAAPGWQLVACPSPYVARPIATIGLGDTFLAGCCLVLGQPPRSARRVAAQ